jgi:hypothetical protein
VIFAIQPVPENVEKIAPFAALPLAVFGAILTFQQPFSAGCTAGLSSSSEGSIGSSNNRCSGGTQYACYGNNRVIATDFGSSINNLMPEAPLTCSSGGLVDLLIPKPIPGGCSVGNTG